MSNNNLELKKVLGPIQIWGLGVGIVISGSYFGWNYGLAESGYVGMLIATAIIGIMYVTLCLSLSELATTMPHAGGAYAFTRRAMGPLAGFITGLGVTLEFAVGTAVFTSGAGYYVHFLIPAIDPIFAAAVLYVFFFIVHILGVNEYATIEMILVTISVSIVLLFSFYGMPYISADKLFGGSLIPGGISGIWAALPYAMWLYICMEMLPMLSEECRNPVRDMPKGIMRAIFTLVILAFLVVTVTVGLGGAGAASKEENPLSYAIAAGVNKHSWLISVLSVVGLFGMLASLAGSVLAYSRQVFALSRAGYLPKFLSLLNKKRRTPYMAIVIPGILGFIFVLMFNPDRLILIATFGALVSYIMMNLSLIILRKKEPELARPYKAPLYPAVPIVSIIISIIALFSSIFKDPTFFFINVAIFAAAVIYFYAWAKYHINKDAPEEQFSIISGEVEKVEYQEEENIN
ncbi:ethanolamine:proton symporter (EAT family) [Scopulibacillus darangshiensis]|uniref:Ethanolamine:proton symporter (EAT family) n=1 Tax=Scopulibacillus darangshiensis TaxID=442528 RepID=A0A4R2NZM6_9BACL|nr:ethanolamine permease [Scopulibacillus darangshiensis]TCP27783.1 ethanolamine:proton symporter (EAT family) [Scopulibacillus darangshiensis]